MRPLLVGESNPYGSDPRYALWCQPPNSAGGRLCRLVLGLTRRDERGRDVADQKTYFRAFERVNLCAGEWDGDEARRSADGLMERAMRTGVTVVLLGAKVTRAFQFDFVPFTHLHYLDRVRVAFLPHPSGLCRAWNEPGAFDRARATLREAGVLPVPPLIPPPREATGDLLEVLPSTGTSTERPAWCDNCHLIVSGEHCPECGPRP